MNFTLSATVVLILGAACFGTGVFVALASRQSQGRSVLGERLESFMPTKVVEPRPVKATGSLWVQIRGRFNPTEGSFLLRWEQSAVGKNLREKLRQADFKIRPSEWILLEVGAGFVLGVLLFLRFSSLIAIPVSFLLVYVGGRFLLRTKKRGRISKFDKQLGEMVGLLSSWIRSGNTFIGAIAEMAEGLPHPMSSELARVNQEISYGVSLEEALAHLITRNPSEDLEILVAAVEIQKVSGGNLAELLENIGDVIRERVGIKQEIKTLTAQARMSGWILICLPLALSALLFLLTPSYFKPMLFTTPGQFLLGTALFCIGIGYLIMRKIVNFAV